MPWPAVELWGTMDIRRSPDRCPLHEHDLEGPGRTERRSRMTPTPKGLNRLGNALRVVLRLGRGFNKHFIFNPKPRAARPENGLLRA